MEIADIIAELRDVTDRLTIESTGANIGSSARWEDVLQLSWRARNLVNAAEEWKRNWKRAQVRPITKWDLVNERTRHYLDNTLLGTPVACNTCGWEMKTEGEFARHYVVTDIDYTNLGTCWTKVAPEYVGVRPWWTSDALAVANQKD